MSSNELFERALAVIPGGVDSPVRSFASVGGEPFFVERAEGPYLFDTDGRRYTDYVQSWGASILGHAHPAVVEAVQRAAAAGTSYGAPTAARSSWPRPSPRASRRSTRCASSPPAPRRA